MAMAQRIKHTPNYTSCKKINRTHPIEPAQNSSGRGEWAPAVEAPQHVAFLTGDAIATARALRERGAPLLEIPGNYYDDLDARLAPPAELLDALRA